jgi:hypothetical protein
MISMRYVSRTLAAIGVALLIPVVHGATGIVEQDTTIDGASSLSGRHIFVVDGSTGPTHVNITGTGAVTGFTGYDNSQIFLNGG